MTKLRPVAALCCVLIALLSACSGNGAPVEQPAVEEQSVQPEVVEATSAPAAEGAVQPEEPEAALPVTDPIEDLFPGEGPWAVPINTADGLVLSATVYGSGNDVIIMAPMYTGQQVGWEPLAVAAGEAGYRAISFDFRGFGQSGGDIDFSQAQTDLTAVVDFAQNTGFSIIAIVGAGEGGTAALQYTIDNGNIPRLAILSSSYEYIDLSLSSDALSSVTIPTLWIAARQDMQHDVIDMSERVGGSPSEIWIYEESSLHGTYLLESLNSEDVQRRILEFIETT